MNITRCDNCGKINPRKYNNNPRLCGEKECLHEKGFYKSKGMTHGTNGKICKVKLRFPIKWIGFFTN